MFFSNFRVTYIINVISSDVMLTLEIEDEITGERWSSEFTSQCKTFLLLTHHLSCLFLGIFIDLTS